MRQNRDCQSGFTNWEQLAHVKDWLLYPQNLGSHLSLDETNLPQGELYTVLINKLAKGGKGSIVAIGAGTKAETVIEVLRKLSENQRKKAKEVTLGRAANMALIVKKCFPKAIQATDRFHVQQLALEAIQEKRMSTDGRRWKPKMRPLKRPSALNEFMNQRCFPMGIHLSNYWLAAAMCSIKSPRIERLVVLAPY